MNLNKNDDTSPISRGRIRSGGTTTHYFKVQLTGASFQNVKAIQDSKLMEYCLHGRVLKESRMVIPLKYLGLNNPTEKKS